MGNTTSFPTEKEIDDASVNCVQVPVNMCFSNADVKTDSLESVPVVHKECHAAMDSIADVAGASDEVRKSLKRSCSTYGYMLRKAPPPSK